MDLDTFREDAKRPRARGKDNIIVGMHYGDAIYIIIWGRFGEEQGHGD